MISFNVLLRFRLRMLFLFLMVEIIFAPTILCKTVTDPNQVHEMNQEAKENHEDAHAGANLNIDPESILHGTNGGHGHPAEAPAEEQPLGAIEPNPEKELHGGLVDVHSDHGSGREVENLGEPGPDQEAMLHGGQKHVHESVTSENESPEVAQGAFGIDPEEMMHDAKDVHSHHGDKGDEKDKDEEKFDFGIDMDAMLHNGEKHVHTKTETGKEEIGEVPIGATDPEALLHYGDGQVHSHARAKERSSDHVPRPYGAADPEQILHGGEEVHDHTLKQAMDGSRPLAGPKDPDEVGMDVNPADVTVGKLRSEDAKDYRQWKEEKVKQEGAKDSSSGWLSGFSYITDAIFRDLEAVKKRYLMKLFSGNEAKKSKEGGDEFDEQKPSRTHDEA